MKIYINSPKEDWVADRYRNEWIQYNKKIFSRNYFGDKLIWIISPWTWRKIPKNILSTKSVLCTIHHIDEDKFNEDEKIDFLERDNFVDHYHAISEKTYNQLKKLTKKPISIIPFWINQNIWNHIENKDKLRTRSSIDLSNQMEGLLVLSKVLNLTLEKWFLSGGTLLGAYRDGDFIPWDWDVEVTVLTEEASKKEGELLNNLIAAGFLIASSDSSIE